MRNWPAALKTMLSGNEITRAFLVEMTSRKQQTLRMTDYSQDITIGVQTFSHVVGFSVTNVRLQSGGSPPQVDVQLPITDEGPVFSEDIRRGVWRGGAISLWLANYADLSGSRGLLVEGSIGDISFSDELVTSIGVLTLGDATQDIVLPRIQPKCRHVFGDYYCGFPVGNVTLPATVASVISNSEFTITVTNPDDFDFTAGAVQMVDGNCQSISIDVRKWTAGTSLVELWDAFPLDIEVGDNLQIHAGCARTRAACAAYDNINHFGGYDHVPGQSFGNP